MGREIEFLNNHHKQCDCMGKILQNVLSIFSSKYIPTPLRRGRGTTMDMLIFLSLAKISYFTAKKHCQVCGKNNWWKKIITWEIITQICGLTSILHYAWQATRQSVRFLARLLGATYLIYLHIPQQTSNKITIHVWLEV